MCIRTLSAVTLLVVAVSAVLAGQPQEREVIAPIVDEKYGSAEEIMALRPERLVGILKDQEASVFARAKACQRLAVTAKASAVPALEALLPDPEVSHYARFALEAIPDPSVDEALRRALGKVEGKLLVGVINSLGRRKDVRALPALAGLLHSEDSEVAQAAAAAMSRIRPAF